MISITDRATAELRKLLESKGAATGQGLRLGVRRGGCAGWQYVMEVGPPASDDFVLELQGARLIVAADSRDKLDGCRVDYSYDLSDSGFRIDNPNAARSCGCGTSFEPAGEDSGGPAVPDGEACGNP